MTLTVVVGSSGSGKTTFLNDTTKSHNCTYIRQYHNIRPYVTVSSIPNFDPTRLPYWDIYEREQTADTIKVGGTMAGEFTAGLSGGQRKLLLFELIVQRTASQSDLLLVFDEPFAGVTDDFVPFIVNRLNQMRTHHNILLVTNDHVDTLKSMADNTITVSAIDRSTVQINGLAKVDRSKAILALSVGEEYQYNANLDDLCFFFDVEIRNSGSLLGVAAFAVFAFGLFMATFWDSNGADSGALVLVAANIIAFFCLNPYLLTLGDWRNYMTEEADALLHSSKSTNKFLKTMVTVVLIFVLSLIEYGTVNLVTDNFFDDIKFWIAMLLDSASVTVPFVFLGLYTKLPFTAIEIFGSMPFLFMIFFSTTFSPGSGVEGFKELRYLFPRFYFWCMVPDVQDAMEGCPESEGENLVYMFLSAFMTLVLFLVYQGFRQLQKASTLKRQTNQNQKMKDDEFVDLQVELYGEEVLLKDSLSGTNHSRRSRTASVDIDSGSANGNNGNEDGSMNVVSSSRSEEMA